MPAPPPAVQLLPAGVAGVTPGFPGFVWPDTSPFGNSPFDYDPATSPVGVVATGGYHGLRFLPTSSFPFPRAVVPAGPFDLFAVVNIPSVGVGAGSALVGVVPAGPNPSLLGIKAASVLVPGPGGPTSFSTGPNFDAVHFFAVVYDGSALTVYRDGLLIGTVVVGPLPPLVVTAPAGLSAGLSAPASVQLIDFRLYDQALPAATVAQLLVTLTALYPPIATVAISCGLCTVGPVRWKLVVSGYTGAASPLNGTWTLTHTTGCNWVSPTVGGAFWSLSFSAAAWGIGGQTGGGVVSGFSLASGGWSCTGANTVPYLSGIGDTGHPSSVTVLPF